MAGLGEFPHKNSVCTFIIPSAKHIQVFIACKDFSMSTLLGNVFKLLNSYFYMLFCSPYVHQKSNISKNLKLYSAPTFTAIIFDSVHWCPISQRLFYLQRTLIFCYILLLLIHFPSSSISCYGSSTRFPAMASLVSSFSHAYVLPLCASFFLQSRLRLAAQRQFLT